MLEERQAAIDIIHLAPLGDCSCCLSVALLQDVSPRCLEYGGPNTGASTPVSASVWSWRWCMCGTPARQLAATEKLRADSTNVSSILNGAPCGSPASSWAICL